MPPPGRRESLVERVDAFLDVAGAVQVENWNNLVTVPGDADTAQVTLTALPANCYVEADGDTLTAELFMRAVGEPH